MPRKDLAPKIFGAVGDPKMKAFAQRLSTDATFRKKFLDEPGSVLKRVGLSVSPNVKLDPRQKAMVELFADPRVSELYVSGDLDGLRKHITERYKTLVGADFGAVAGWAIADFDVAIEAEAVAVAVVAVAAVAIGVVDQFARLREFEANAAVLTARITALEARAAIVDRLERKLDSLEKRIG